MWIVRLALRRPYTFIVMAILIGIIGGLSIVTTPTDIFPYINIPMVGVIWSYNGMSPDDMARRVLFVSERAMTTTVNNIERIEATAYNGVGLIRVYMQQGTNVDLAVAQVTGSFVWKRIVGHGHFQRVGPPESDPSDRHR